ncbi:MAG: transposase [Anaerolineales bacterium]|nr:transposase [Anaerolineales bacterium]MBX3036312.1 transposase [Anaerolineales bacterium]
MPVKPNFNPNYLYFVTTTVEQHIHIFKDESIIRIILDSLHFLQTNRQMELFCFVIMPNHIHIISRFSEKYTPSDAMRDFKRHTARQIISQFKAKGQKAKLEMLHGLNQHTDQEYKVWEDGFDARDIFSQDFLQQKMEYIHYNPCRPKWKLANTPEEYPWSSARFYYLDEPCIIPVDDVRNLFI